MNEEPRSAGRRLRELLPALLAALSLALPLVPPSRPAQADLLTGDLPAGLDDETRSAIGDLDHPDWRLREAASAWLVEEAPRWARRIPADWAPRSAEARFRFARVVELVAALETLPALLVSAGDERGEGRLAQLREEAGCAFLDALERALGDPDARVRSAAVERLGETLAGRNRLMARSLGHDPSARVLASLYEVARRHDREWAFSLVLEAFRRDDSPHLLGAAAEGARRLGDPRLLPELRRHFHAPGEPHPEIVIALAAFALPEDAAAVDRLLRSPEYRHVSLALDSLGAAQVRRHERAIEELLSSEHWDFRVRALRRLEEEEGGRACFRLLPLLEHPDEEVYLFAAESLVRLGGEDFLGDIEVSLRRFPAARRPFAIILEEGRPVPRALVRGEDGAPMPAVAPGAETPAAGDR